MSSCGAFLPIINHILAVLATFKKPLVHGPVVLPRDIKTSNILLSREGVAKIADVGLAVAAGKLHL